MPKTTHIHAPLSLMVSLFHAFVIESSLAPGESNVQVSFEQQPRPLSYAGKGIVEAIKKKLNECFTNHHSTCPSNLDRPLPSRVINVEAKDRPEGLSLHISELNESGEYVALSYCCK